MSQHLCDLANISLELEALVSDLIAQSRCRDGVVSSKIQKLDYLSQSLLDIAKLMENASQLSFQTVDLGSGLKLTNTKMIASGQSRHLNCSDKLTDIDLF